MNFIVPIDFHFNESGTYCQINIEIGPQSKGPTLFNQSRRKNLSVNRFFGGFVTSYFVK